METAAKKKNSLALVVIASIIAWVSACLLSSAAMASSASATMFTMAPSIEPTTTTTASTHHVVGSKSRAESFLGVSLKSVELLDASPANATRYYDGVGEVALECLVAPSKGLRLSEGSGVGPLVNEAKLGKILSNLESRGVKVVRGVDAASILENAGANAAYMNWFGKPHLYFGNNVTRGQLVEELLHHGQSLRRGHAASQGGIAMQRLTYLDEIAAQKYMINHATRKSWTQAEVSHYQNQLSRWQKLLDDLGR